MFLPGYDYSIVVLICLQILLKNCGNVIETWYGDSVFLRMLLVMRKFFYVPEVLEKFPHCVLQFKFLGKHFGYYPRLLS